MSEGMTLRLRRIFAADGRAVVVAADHGAIAGPLPGIESADSLTALCARGGADAIIAHRGFVRAAQSSWTRGLGLVLRLSGGFTTLGGKFEEEPLGDAEDAVFWGADAVAITVKFGHAREGEFIRNAARLVSTCERRGIPTMIEAMAFNGGAQSLETEDLAVAVRSAEELGAAFIKAPLPAHPREFSRVIRGSRVPVLILGGDKLDSLEALYSAIAGSMDAGAAGVAMGRNIWGQTPQVGVLEATVGLVHGGWGVETALAYVRA